MLCAAPAFATTYYVDDGGSDGNSCATAQTNSTATAKATIQNALAICISPGDTLIVKDGTYTAITQCGDTYVICTGLIGTTSAWVTIKSENGCSSAAPPVCGAVLDGVSNSGGYAFGASGSGSFIQTGDYGHGFEVKGFSSDGFVFNNSGSNFRVYGNYIHDIGRFCNAGPYGVNGVFSRRPNTDIRGNYFDTIGRYVDYGGTVENGCGSWPGALDHAIYLAGDSGGANNSIIINNAFVAPKSGWAIQLYPGALSGVEIRNNSFAGHSPVAYIIGHIIAAAQLTSVDIANNASYDSQQSFIYWYTGPYSGVTVRTNLIQAGAVGDTNPGGVSSTGNTTGTDPKFTTSTAPYNFALLSTSPAIDQALTLSDVTVDRLNVARPKGPAPDIGSDEYDPGTGGTGGGGSPPPPLPTDTTPRYRVKFKKV